MAIGDCNVVLGADECLGGVVPLRSSCEDFRSTMYLCDFTHLDTYRAFFTWARGKGSNHIERRLIGPYAMIVGLILGCLQVLLLFHE